MKCIIVDDERLAQQVIEAHIKKIGRFELAGICSNVKEAADLLNTEDIDLMFLDIQLPGTTGLQFLTTLEDPPLVVLTTAYAEYAVESYEYNVVDYLLKPISFDRFAKTVNKIIDGKMTTDAKDTADSQTDHLFIKSNSKFFRVNFSDIIYVEGMRDYLKIHTTGNTIVTHQTMQEMEDMLPAKQFQRIHRSYIISLNHIRSIYGNAVEMGNATVPVGASYKEQVMKLIKK